jgi:predicted nucleic acid-binding Zn ribbon protein
MTTDISGDLKIMESETQEYGETTGSEQNMATEPARRRREAVRLGDVVRELMDNQISRRQADFRSAEEFWSSTLPVELLQHCRIAGISGGKLTVEVDSPSYMYEMQLASYELLKGMQRQCPRVPVEKIKLVLA